MADHYFIDDAANYTKSFQQYATNYGSLMRIVEANCFPYQEIPAKELFDATGDLMYPVNGLYKKQNNIEDGETSYVTYVKKDELKTMLAEVVQEYFKTATIKND